MIPRFSESQSPSSGSLTIPETTAEGTAIRWSYRLKPAAIKEFQTELATNPDRRPFALDRRDGPHLNPSLLENILTLSPSSIATVFANPNHIRPLNH